MNFDSFVFKHPHKYCYTIVCIVFLLIFSKTIQADEFDTFNVVVGSSFTHDSNIFKTRSGVNAIPGEGRSDNILSNTLGFKIKKQYSLQTFLFDYSHVENKYQNFNFLEFNANNYKLAWQWSITPFLKGNLSADRTEAMGGFADFRNFNAQNIRTTETKLVDLDYSPFNNWHLLAGLNKVKSDNSQVFLQDSSSEIDTLQAGLRYVFPSSTSIELMIRDKDGKYGREIPNQISFTDTGFEESEEELKFAWPITGKSKVTSNFGHVSRKHDNLAVRDYAGNFGGITYAWDVTGQVNLSVGLSRRISSFQTANSSYTEIDTIAINPTWQISSKLSLRGNLQAGKRNFKGEGPLVANGREDDTELYGLSLNWVPRNTIQIGLNLQRDERDSNVQIFDYSANTASISATATF